MQSLIILKFKAHTFCTHNTSLFFLANIHYSYFTGDSLNVRESERIFAKINKLKKNFKLKSLIVNFLIKKIPI